MRQDFAYEKTSRGICIRRCYGNSAYVKIPAMIEGEPVTELAAYVFAAQQEEEPENLSGLPCVSGMDFEGVSLPPGIQRIGRYAFYNCYNFHKMECSSSIAYMGAGIFTGCENLKEIILYEELTKPSCLREILSDLKQAVFVKVQREDGKQYQLEYPEFFEEAVENTPARIIETHTHGMGIQYRNTFRDTRVVFLEYDKLFETGKYNLELDSAVRMAAARLEAPLELSDASEKAYREFLEEHAAEAGEIFLEDIRRLLWFAETFVQEEAVLKELIALAEKRKKLEALSVLMDVKHRRFAGGRKKFSLSL